MNKALADNDHIKAKQVLCDMGKFSESECQDTGRSSILRKVVDVLIQQTLRDPLGGTPETYPYANRQVDDAKQGNIVISKKKG